MPAKKKLAKPRRGKKASPRDAIVNPFQHLDILHIRLLQLNAQLSIHGGRVPNQAEVFHVTKIGPTPDNSCLHVNIALEVNGRPEGVNKSATPVSEMRIQMEYQCVFRVRDVPIQDLLPAAKEIATSGSMMAWPYMRELVQTINARMQIAPFILPVLMPHELEEATVEDLREKFLNSK